MNRYNRYSSDPSFGERQRKRRTVHPIWQGFGLILLILIPILAYTLTLALIDANQANRWVAIPASLLLRSGDPYMVIKGFGTILLSFVLYFLMTFLGVLILQLGGHRRYGPLDVPPDDRPRRS